VAFGAVDASLKIKSKNGINIPRETIENIMERRINRQYQKTSPLYCPMYLKMREYRFMYCRRLKGAK
jgi:hypothetical protein